MPIETIHTQNLDEFWGKISPIGELVSSLHSPIFRGQSNADWGLCPSLFREEFYSKHSRPNFTSIDTKYLLELFFLAEYMYHLDMIGLSVPGDSKQLRDTIDAIFPPLHLFPSWPPAELIPLCASAQHHGIPTRLLDFTRNPIVAAYFSAATAIRDNKDDEKLIEIWILDESKLKETQLKTVSVPGSTSQNVAAQKALFLLLEDHGREFITPIDLSREKTKIVNFLRDHETITAYQITLKAKYAGYLLERCQKFGISASSLFPGYDGAAKAVMDTKIGRKFSGLL